MKKLNILLLLAASAITLARCYKDRGNNDYTTIEGIKIEGIEDHYVVRSMEERLKISPVITTDFAEADLEYIWLAYPSSGSKVTLDTIAVTKELDYDLTLPQGNYILTLKVQNKANGYFVYKQVGLESTTRFSRGFYVLKETSAGDTDMDLHMDIENKAEDLIVKSVGESLSGKPVKLSANFNHSFIDPDEHKLITGRTLIPMSENDFRTIRISDMRQIYTREEMFFREDYPTSIPILAIRAGSHFYFLTEDGVWSTAFLIVDLGTLTSGKFGIKQDVEFRTRFGLVGGSMLFIYDELGKRFMTTNAGKVIPFFDVAGNPHSPNDVPHECLYMSMFQNTGAGMQVFSVHRNADDPSQRMIYVIKLVNGNYNNPIEEVVSFGTAPSMNSAVRYAGNTGDVRMVYGLTADNKYYCYDIQGHTETPMTVAGLPAGEEVTYMAHKIWKGGDLATETPYHFSYFVVATHKDGNYKIHFYNMLGGLPTGDPEMVFTGVGKVADLQYASTTFIGLGDASKYSY